MSLVSFKKGLKTNLPASGVDGTLYLTTDTGELFASDSSSYTKVSDIVICATVNDLPVAGSEISTKLYYVTDTNSLYKVKSGAWEALGSEIFAHTYSSGTGINITSANVINHSNNIIAGTSPASSGTLTPGGTLIIPQFTYDSEGHVTAVTSSTCTLPTPQGSVTDVAAGVGLITADGSDITSTGTIKAKVTRETALDINAEAAVTTGTAGRLYPVQIDNSGYLAVNVPWEANTNTITSVNGQSSGAVVLGASDVGAVDSSLVGTPSGVAELDSNGKVPASQLPSYVDDVLEGYYDEEDHKFYEEEFISGYYDSANDTFYEEPTFVTPIVPVVGKLYKDLNTSDIYEWDGTNYVSATRTEIIGEAGKIYMDLFTDSTYRWGGSSYAQVGSSLSLGELSTNAYRGDRGAEAYAHAVTNKGVAFAEGLYKVTTNAEGHVTAATAVAKADITALGIPGQDTTYSLATIADDGLMPQLDGASSTKYLKGNGTWDNPFVEISQADYNVLEANNQVDPNVNYYIYDAALSAAPIDDGSVSDVRTWSSSKIDSFNTTTTFAVATTGWTQDTTSQPGKTLYKKEIALTEKPYKTNLKTDIGCASGSTLPTLAQQESYDLLQYVTVTDTSPYYLYLYAKEEPTTAFYIKVEGVS